MIEGLVSIISPCYNGERYLENFLKSVLSQTYDMIELIVINDGSNDNTEQILAKFENEFKEHGYIYYHYYQENKGQAAAINKGLGLYKGEYLMWVDSDDILLDENVKKKVEFLQKHPECGMVLCEGEVVQSNNLNKPTGVLRRKKPKGEDNLFEDLIFERNVVYGPASIMTKRSVLNNVLPNNHIYESRQGQNWQLMLPLAYSCKCGYIEEILFKCVAHADSHSRNVRSYDELIRRCDEFVVLLKETIDSISTMPSQQKEKWKLKIVEKYDIRKLSYSYLHKRFQDSRKIRRKIASYMGKSVWKYSYLNYVFEVLKNGLMCSIKKLNVLVMLREMSKGGVKSC